MGKRRKILVSLGLGFVAVCGRKAVEGKGELPSLTDDTNTSEAGKDCIWKSPSVRGRDSFREDRLDSKSDYGSCTCTMSDTWNKCLSDEDTSSGDDDPAESAQPPDSTFTGHQPATSAEEGRNGGGSATEMESDQEDPRTAEEPPAKQRQKQSHAVSGILSLLGAVKPGGDVSKLQIPPQFNLPKSQLQLYGESVYGCRRDLLQACTDGATATDRMLAVVRWHISTTRLPEFGKAPLNPIQGETHHVTSGDLNVLVEQVSHHPPISALHATNDKAGVSMTWWHQPVPRFHGANMEAEIKGRRLLRLHRHNEVYETTSPRLHFRFLPSPGTDWVGKTRIVCLKSGMVAEVELKTWGLFGGGDHRVNGTITDGRGEVVVTIRGYWDSEVKATDARSGEELVLYRADMISDNAEPPDMGDNKEVLPTESLLVWSDVNDGINSGNWAAAREAKTSVEKEERAKREKGKAAEEVWEPRYFSKDVEGDGWRWKEGEKGVKVAPSTVPAPRLL